MFRQRHVERMRSAFLEQFEADVGGNYLFRKSGKGPPIRVTATERDAFAAEFVKRVQYIVPALTLATLLTCIVPVLLAPDSSEGVGDRFVIVGTLTILMLSIGVGMRAWTAPARALERRPLLGLARSRTEMRRRVLAQTTYGQLAVGLAVTMLVGLSDGINIWRTAPAGVVAIVLLVQCVRKWRFERRRNR